jgi:hypothetical protein
VSVLTIGVFLASIPAYYDWLVDLSGPEVEAAVVRANLEAIGISLDSYAKYLISISVASTMVWIAVGVVIFWRRSDDWMALVTSLGLLTFSVFATSFGPIMLAEQYPTTRLTVHLLGFLGSISLYLFFYLFPNGRFVPRWTRWVAVCWAAHEIPYWFFPDSIFNIDRSLPLLDFVAISTFICVGIGSQLYRYRRVSGPVQRQQTKWVVYGTVLSGLGAVGFAVPLSVFPTLSQYGSLGALVIQVGNSGSMLLFPLSIGVAILRHHLWDIDIIINRTLIYGSLTTVLAAVFAITDTLLLPLLVQTFLGEEDPTLNAVISAVIIAVLFEPLRRRIKVGVNKLSDWLSDWLAGGDGTSESPR